MYLLFTMGSGSKLDANLEQPSLVRLSDLVRRIQPGAVFAKHLYRMGRSPWAFGPIVTELNSRNALLGDASRGLRRPESVDSIMLFFDASHGQAEAEEAAPKSRKGMRSRTETRMVDGAVVIAAQAPLPPGLARLRLRHKSHQGPSVYVFERPGSLPPESDVAYGYPEVTDDSGVVLDQVENVRWALSLLGTGPDNVEIGRGLVARGFSTVGVRSHGGPAAVHTNPKLAINAVIDALEFYKTGVLRVRIGAGFDDIEVTGLTPEGGWATPERFAEIDEFRARCRAREEQRSHSTFAGLAVTYNGELAKLAHYHRGTRETGRQMFVFKRPKRPDGQRGRGSAITHDFLADAIVSGLVAAGDKALRLAPTSTAVRPELAAELGRLEVRRSGIAANMESVLDQLQETGRAGRRIITGALLDQLNARYNDLAGELTGVERAISDLNIDIAREGELAAKSEVAALTETLLGMVASLRDPHSTQYRYVWCSAIRDLTVTSVRRTECGLKGEMITISGCLRVGQPGTQVDIPFKGCVDTLEPQLTERIARMTAQMRNGAPFNTSAEPMAEKLRPAVADALGIEPRRFGLSHCDDPRLLRLAMSRCYPEHGPSPSNREVAEQFGEPEALIRRIAHIWLEQRPQKWQLHGSHNLVTVHLRAALGDGTVHIDDLLDTVAGYESLSQGLKQRELRQHWKYQEGRLTVEPCATCGSIVHAPAIIREVVGTICLGCSRDRHGVLWPLDPYVHLLDDVHAWHTSGLLPRQLPPNPFTARGRARRDIGSGRDRVTP